MGDPEPNSSSEFSIIYDVFLNSEPYRRYNFGFWIFIGLDSLILILVGCFAVKIDYQLALFSFLQLGFLSIGGLFLYIGNKQQDEVEFNQNTLNFRVPSETITFYRKFINVGFYCFISVYFLIRIIDLFPIYFSFPLSSYQQIVFFYALGVSVSEEIFFRAFLLKTFWIQISKEKEGRTQNILPNQAFWILFLVNFLQSCIWTLLHVNYYGNLLNLIPIFFSGVIFGLFYVYKKDIRWTIALHFFGNLIANFIYLG